ncbi:MAG: exodeoxyribonuclease III [Candidatus Methylopumilus sp.]|nr:exodeoxyribonuclease III [Candidatus Methylopumilus sp.]
MRIITLNMNGIRSASNKGVYTWLNTQDADFICVQEVKAHESDLTHEMKYFGDYMSYFSFAEKKGYSGVSIYAKKKPLKIIREIGLSLFDHEGRYLELRYNNLNVVSIYLPSGSSGEERQAFKFEVLDYLLPYLKKRMTLGEPIVLCGDWNIAHQDIDLKNYKGNRKNSGFLPQERQWMTYLFRDGGFIDVYRKLYPDTTDVSYTWWSNRGQAYLKNVGWRIDYQIAHPLIGEKVISASIFKDEKFSDHAPLIVDYDF